MKWHENGQLISGLGRAANAVTLIESIRININITIRAVQHSYFLSEELHEWVGGMQKIEYLGCLPQRDSVLR